VRRINEPAPAQVWLDEHDRPTRVAWRTTRPGAVRSGAAAERVECVLDTWCVDDAWWTERPVRRIYHEVQLVSGVRLVLSWDLVEQRWMAQR
jgi:hypothetical protein